MTAGLLNGVSMSRAVFSRGAWGAWGANLELTDDPRVIVGETATGVIGGLPFLATVIAAGDDGSGKWGVHLTGGRGGWAKTIPRKPYRNDLGVTAAEVLQAAANDCGEVIDPTPYAAVRLGPHFARPDGPAFRVLNGVAPKDWRLNFATGVTELGPLIPSVYAGDAVVSRRAPAVGVLELDVESLLGLEPGVIVEGLPPATDVEYAIEGPTLTARVYYAPSLSDRALEAFATIFEALDPWRKFRGIYDARVVLQSGNKLTIQPVRTSTGLPILEGVPFRTQGDVRVTHTPGAVVCLAFADGDPSRPFCFAGDSPDNPASAFLSYQIGGPGGLGIAYQGSTVQAGPFAGTVTLGSTRARVTP